MNGNYDFLSLLTKAELNVLAHPEKWRWISSLAPPDVKPVRRADHQAWGKIEGNTHAPPQRELFLALSGSMVFIHKEKVFPITPGVVTLFNSRENHDKDTAPYNKGYRHLWLHTSNHHVVSSYLHEVDLDGNRTSRALKFMTGNNAHLLMDAWDGCANKDTHPIHFTFLKSLITSYFLEALSNWKLKPAFSPHQQIVETICDYIDKNLGADLSLENLAHLAGYSPFFFHRLFQRHKKMPVHRYIILARLEHSKKLLQQGLTMSAVSEKIGMESPAYFSRFFKKHTRITASRWRDLNAEI